MSKLTPEQRAFVRHPAEAFVQACPGGGKTRTIVARVQTMTPGLPPRKGIAVLSFTNSAIEEFLAKSRALGLDAVSRHPNFVGTFDSFVRQFFITPFGLRGVAVRATVVDSWNTLGVDIRLRGRDAFRGPGVPLDRFEPVTNAIDPALIGHHGVRAHVQANKAAYEQAARQVRLGFRRKGYVSAADARVEAIARLRDVQWSASLRRAITARFHEVIVDEAQDCNPLDLQLLTWLRGDGLRVTLVSDLDQAIYGFRQGDPTALKELSEAYGRDNNLGLSGNFRSSPAICHLAATLRSRAKPDEAVGENAAVTLPIYILMYEGNTPPASIHISFNHLCEQARIAAPARIVLAHARRSARNACGLGSESDGGNSKVARLARATGIYHANATSGRAREACLVTIEQVLLDLMGKGEEQTSIARITEQHGIDRRWLRRIALQLVTRLSPACADSDDGRGAWIDALHNAVAGLALTFGEGVTATRYFRKPHGPEWSQFLHPRAHLATIAWATIHEAKGSEHGGVCVVIPPGERTEELIAAWENRVNSEPKRVIYVGVTRAEKLLAIALPAAFAGRVAAVLQAGKVPFESHHLVAAGTAADLQGQVQAASRV
ncbi:MAG: UvrD-helicase domain-containing protein [Roseiarcus sp.]